MCDNGFYVNCWRSGRAGRVQRDERPSTFDYSARENLTAEFAVQGTRRVSYAEAQALPNRIANALVAKGLVPGDRVALLSKNSIEHALWYYACSKAGVVPVPLNFRLAPVRGELASVKHWIALGTDVRGRERFEALVAVQPPSTPDDDCLAPDRARAWSSPIQVDHLACA